MNKDLEAFNKAWVKESVRGVGIAGNEYFESPCAVAQRNRKKGALHIWQAACSHKQSEIDELKQVVRELESHAMNMAGYIHDEDEEGSYCDKLYELLERNKEILGRVE